jgi:hypothetical protein
MADLRKFKHLAWTIHYPAPYGTIFQLKVTFCIHTAAWELIWFSYKKKAWSSLEHLKMCVLKREWCELPSSVKLDDYMHTHEQCIFILECAVWILKPSGSQQTFAEVLDETSILQASTHNWKWLCKSAHILDIFDLLSLNLSFQGNVLSIFHVKDKMSMTITELKLWAKSHNHGKQDSFPSL